MATIIFKPKKDNAKLRRLAKQMAFWDKKRAEYEAKPKVVFKNLCHILNSKKRGMTYEKSII